MLPGAIDLCGPVPPESPNQPLVQKLIKKLNAEEPIYVDVNPHVSCIEGDCFNNVSRLIANSGGEMVLGWCVWEHPKLFARAEHHAIWRKTDGALVDPTPKDGDFKKILFVADPTATWIGQGHKGKKSVWQENSSKRDAVELVRLEKLREDILEEMSLAKSQSDVVRIGASLKRVNDQLSSLDYILFKKGILKIKKPTLSHR